VKTDSGDAAVKTVNIARLGSKFMGKAHSHAWLNVRRFFDSELTPVLKVVCGQRKAPLDEFAARWGWEETETNWERVVERNDIDVVDIALPTYLHHPVALAAAAAGKHVFCEKPFALDAKQAREMHIAAKQAGVVHYLNHNYRRCPAVALARQLIDEGKVGRVFHLPDYAPTPRFSIEEIRGFGEPMVAITVEASRETHHERGSNEVWVRRGASNERPKPSGTRSLFGNNTV